MSAATQARLSIRPCTLAEAKVFVGREHRHHPPSVGHKFSVAVEAEGQVVGVAVAGRPSARGWDQKLVLEVTRLATDGTPNACSALYGAVARIGTEMGYERHQIITYILASEPGTSLRAAGWWFDRTTKGGSWDTPSRRRTDKAPTEPKQLWRAAPTPNEGSDE